MKNTGLAILASCLFVTVAVGEPLSDADAGRLRAEIAAMMTAFEGGDPSMFLELTHPPLQSLAGGPDAFAALVRQSLDALRQGGVKMISAEVGAPTQTYSAGEEELCCVPRVTVMEVHGRRARSTTFMIAIRRVGDSQWKYLDGAGLRRSPDLLCQLVPKLERGIALPANQVEAL
jgi:hypothetical protein